jgi:methionine-rich copper-binding protein CopC
MSFCIPARVRIALALLLLTIGFAPAASAATATFKILMDLDDNPGTGCTVPTLTGTFKGVEQILLTTVTTSSGIAQVTALQVQTCTAPPSTFSALAAVPAPAGHPLPWPVGIANGTGGTSVIETYYPLSLSTVGNPLIVRLGVLGFDSTGTLTDEMLTTQPAGGFPILLQAASIAQIPTLTEWGLIFLSLALAFAALAVLRRRRTAGTVLLALLLLGAAGVAWSAAVGCDLDGTTTGEWSSANLLATDAADAPAGADMRAFYGFKDATAGALCFRIDAKLVFNSKPVANPDSYTTVQDTVLNVPAPGVLGNDQGGNLTATPKVLANTAQGGKVTLNADGSFTYMPPAGFSGTDTFNYTANNLLGSATGTVTITVTDKPPVVTGSTPANGASGVALSSTIKINFSEPVNVTASAFKLECPSGTPVPFSIAPVPPGGAGSFVLTPSANLPASTTCKATVVAAQVTDVDHGNHPTADTTFSFSTDAAPTVTSTTPANGATKVAITSTVTVNFSESVNVTATAFKLECPSGTPVAFTVTPASPATSFVLHPTSNLPGDVTCRVTVVASQVTDVDAGTHLGADFVFTFTTNIPPTVSSTTPANGATGVALSTDVTVVFSEPVNVTASAFKLECPSGTPVAFTTSSSPATTFTLHPTSLLPPTTTCTLTVVATQVTDVDAGTAMQTDKVVTFTTDTPPTVSSTTPTNGATGVAVTSTVTVNFSESVNVTGSAFKLECPAGTPVAFTVTPASPATSFVLHPTSPLPGAVTCKVTVVAAQVTDVDAGTKMQADKVVTFTTDAPPSVSTTVPANGATTVPPNTTITINFSEPVNVTASAFKLECPVGTPVAFTVTPASPASSFVLHPTSKLPTGVVCTVTVVANQVTDTDTGQNMTANFVFTFTTDLPPSVSTTVPANGATTVPPNTTITINFSESVNVTGSAFKLECPTGTPVAFTVTPASPATSFVLHPTSPLPGGVICTATVVANQVSDVDVGQNMTANFVFSFTIDAPPTVTTTVPANGATGVSPAATVTVSFSEPVNVTGSAFKLECPAGTPVAFTVTPASPAASFVLHPTSPLPGGVTCTATVVANQVADVDVGQNMAANFVFSFTIDTPPSVTSTTPANGATGVVLNSTVTVSFSEPVNVTGTAFKLECPAGTPVAFTVTPASPASSFVLHPSSPLPAGVTCKATVLASQVTDVDVGQNMVADFVFSFTTDVPPSVTSTVPANGATLVLPTATVTVNFSEPVNVTGSAFKLECPAGTPVAFTVTPASPASSFVLHPTSGLPTGVTCTVTVVAAQVTDVDAGQNMTADFVFTFDVDSPPSVTSTTPANGATGVAPSSTVTINFSESVNVTPTAFKLECPTGTPAAFTVTTPSPASSFVLQPTAPLPSGVICTVTVVASQVTDVDAGQNMTANFTASFTIDAAPTVTSTVPTNGATSVSPSTTVTINFSEPVNVTATAFKLECPAGTPVAFTVTPASPASSFVLHPTSNLPAGVTCKATVVANQVSDVDVGQNMAADYVFSFTIDTPPSVTTTVPANGAVNVTPTSTVTINFSEPVNVTGTAFKLECPAGTPVAFTVTPASPASSFVLHPTSPLPGNVTCTVTVVAAQVTDVDLGQNMTADYVFSFGTDAPPTVTSTMPTNGATAVLPTATVTIKFSEPVNVTGTAFKLECPAGTPVAFTVTPASPASSFVLHPMSNLPAGTTCTVTVVAAQVTDVDAGQNLSPGNYVFSFTINTLPTVTSTVPTNGATNVDPATTVTVNFSEPVNVTPTAFKLECPVGTPVAFTVTPASPASSFVLHPTAKLPGGVTCTVTVVATQVTDVDAGQNMAADFTASFTTDQPPSVSSVVPANGAINVALNATVTITFSE